MFDLYPVLLKLEGKRCVVVGGGSVAARKVRFLLLSGARVMVVSPELIDDLMELKENGEIEYLKGSYSETCLDGAFLAIGATADPELNGRVAADAGRRGILVNIVDTPAECDFFIPSVVRRGDLAISISTSGKSPALARTIRKRLEKEFGEEYAEFLRILGSVREVVARRVEDRAERERLYYRLVGPEVLALVDSGRIQEARDRVEAILSEEGLSVHLS